MTATTNYSYSIAPQWRDHNGIWRDQFARDPEPGEIESLEQQGEIGEFQGAEDLPEGVEFARAMIGEQHVRIYREPAS